MLDQQTQIKKLVLENTKAKEMLLEREAEIAEFHKVRLCLDDAPTSLPQYVFPPSCITTNI